MASLLALFAVVWLLTHALVESNVHASVVDAVTTRFARTPGRALALTLVLTVLLSAFLSNLLTAMVMLPALARIAQRAPAAQRASLRQHLGLAVIHGANIGGMASLVGSPANALALGALAMFNVAGREQLGVLRWAAAAAPVALTLTLASWWLVGRSLRRCGAQGAFAVPPAREGPVLSAAQRGVVRDCLALLGLFALLGFGLQHIHDEAIAWPIGAAFVAAGLWWRGLLDARRLLRGLPWRGLLLAAAAAGLASLLWHLGAVEATLDALRGVMALPGDASTLTTWLVVPAVFLTEVVSNTAASVALWGLASALAHESGYSALHPIVAVGWASLTAFMTPIATPSTALIFGELPDIGLRRLALVGLLMNVWAVAAILATARWWLPVVLPAG